MRRLALAVLVALLAPALVAAHPVDMGNDVTMEVHLVDAATGEVFEPYAHDRLPTGRGDALLANRSYLLEVRMLDDGVPVEGRVSALYNGSTRHYRTGADGVAVFPVGNPLGTSFRAYVYALPDGWEITTWEGFDWAVLPSDGPREPEPQDRWGYAADATWRTHEWTVDAEGYSRTVLSWGSIGDGAGGFFALIHVNDTRGTQWTYVWSAPNGNGGPEVVAAALDEEARVKLTSPVLLQGGRMAINAEGVLPTGSVITITHGVVNPANAAAFRVEVEADDGVLSHAIDGSGAMTIHGTDDLDGGLEATATAYGVGYADRHARAGTITLPANGTVLLHASPAASEGTFAWRHHGEEATARVFGRDWFWKATGDCAGDWWRRMDASTFGESWFNVLHLHDHGFPDAIDATFDHAIGGGDCRRLSP